MTIEHSSVGYTINNQANQALELFSELNADALLLGKDREESNLTIYACLIHALAHLAMLPISETMVKEIPVRFLSHPHPHPHLTLSKSRV